MARTPYLRAVWVLPALWGGAAATAAAGPPPAVVLLDLVAEDNRASWVAEALELNMERELASYQRMTSVDEAGVETEACSGDTACLLSAYSTAGADIVMLGRVAGGSLHYRLYETWTPALVEDGVLDVGSGATLISLKQQTLRAFRAFLTQGGLLDQKPFLAATRTARSVPAVDRRRARHAAVIVLAAMAVLFALPLGVYLFTVRRRSLSRLVRLPSAMLSVGIAMASAGLAVLVSGGDFDVADALRRAEGTWWVGVLGGIGWGGFLLESSLFAFPPLHGLSGVGHRDVFRLIAGWFYACLQRTVLMVMYYAPFALVLVWVSDAMSVPTRSAIVLLAPVTGLVARLWIAEWVECLTPYVDDRVVIGDASPLNPWHIEVHHYLMGYVRRLGWSIDRRRLRRVLFMPSRIDGVVSWGGGAIASRIAIDERLLQLAMGGIERSATEESAVEWPTWSDGVLVAQRGKPRPPRRRAPVRPRSVIRRRHSHADLSYRRPQIGQAATLLGYVVATSPDERVPLIADDVADLDVIRSLLAEHYPWMQADPDEEDDDTDPTDRDFLFGVLAREIGVIERRDNQPATLVRACLELVRGAPRVVRQAVGVIHGLAETFTSRFPTFVADAYAALNFGRDHLIQYLYLRQTHETHGLTSRARPEHLEQRSAELLDAAANWSCTPRERFALHASHRNRLVWLSRLCPRPIDEPREARLRIVVAGVIALATAAYVSIAVKRAVDYHPVYVDGIAKHERRLRATEQAGQDRGPKRQPIHDGRLKEADK